MIHYIFLALLMLFTSAHAVQFSATAVMSSPGRADITSRIYFSPEKIRKEFFYYGEPVVEILNSKAKISLMCFSDQKICYENTLLEKINVGISEAKANPCSTLKNIKCTRIGEEILNKRKAIKWKLSRKQGEKVYSSYVWVDAEINIPVKNLENKKSTLELVWQGNEQIGNRKTQKWLEIASLKDGQLVKRQQWFDTELKISIRQLYPNGSYQELKDIVIEKLDQNLFKMPVGFKKKVVRSRLLFFKSND